MEGWIAVTRTPTLKVGQTNRVTFKNKNYVVWKSDSCGTQIMPDACCHRGASLSLGKIERDGSLTCGYHGWNFKCNRMKQPWSETSEQISNDFDTLEQDGLLWIRPRGLSGTHGPPSVPYQDDASYNTAWFDTEINQCAQLIIENGIDPAHASWVHANGLGFGTEDEEPTDVVHGWNTITFGYVPNKYAFTTSFFGARNTKNFHAFELPYTTWSEVILESGKKLMTYVTLCPISDLKTKMFVAFANNLGVPSDIFVMMGKEIVNQDRKILENQDPSFATKGLSGKYDQLSLAYRNALQNLIFK